MEIDIFTIIAAAFAICLSTVAALASLLLIIPRRKENEATNNEGSPKEGVSIVVACHDNAYELEHNLPALLEQQYPCFEVIVVDESSTDDTDEVLKQLKSRYPNLYTTFIPESSHYLSRRKLALTVGVKAAKYEWIVFADATNKPIDDQWLATFASQCCKGKDIVMGYANYNDEAKAYYRFRQLVVATRNLRRAQRSVAYASGGNTIAIRRSVFMGANGFLKDLTYLRGEYDFLVNEYANADNVGVAIGTKMEKGAPSKRSWINDNLFYMETRRHLSRSTKWRIPFVADTLLLHLAVVVDVAMIAIAAVVQDWVAMGAAIFALLLVFALRTIFAVRAAKALGERLNVALVPLMELRMAWTNLALAIRYKMSDKYDFIRK